MDIKDEFYSSSHMLINFILDILFINLIIKKLVISMHDATSAHNIYCQRG
jgi:hypothetical protein